MFGAGADIELTGRLADNSTERLIGLRQVGAAFLEHDGVKRNLIIHQDRLGFPVRHLAGSRVVHQIHPAQVNSVVVRLRVKHIVDFEFREIPMRVRADDYVQLRECAGNGVDLVSMIVATLPVALMNNQHDHLRAGATNFRHDCF